jgi:hypothetical protein
MKNVLRLGIPFLGFRNGSVYQGYTVLADRSCEE